MDILVVFPPNWSQCRSAPRHLISVRQHRRAQRLVKHEAPYQGEENSPEPLLKRFPFGSYVESFSGSGSGAVKAEPGCAECLSQFLCFSHPTLTGEMWLRSLQICDYLTCPSCLHPQH